MWIVFEVEVEHRRLWAWARPWQDAPGFAEIWYTTDTGDLVSSPEPTPPLGSVLFTVPGSPA